MLMAMITGRPAGVRMLPATIVSSNDRHAWSEAAVIDAAARGGRRVAADRAGDNGRRAIVVQAAAIGGE